MSLILILEAWQLLVVGSEQREESLLRLWKIQTQLKLLPLYLTDPPRFIMCCISRIYLLISWGGWLKTKRAIYEEKKITIWSNQCTLLEMCLQDSSLRLKGLEMALACQCDRPDSRCVSFCKLICNAKVPEGRGRKKRSSSDVIN